MNSFFLKENNHTTDNVSVAFFRKFSYKHIFSCIPIPVQIRIVSLLAVLTSLVIIHGGILAINNVLPRGLWTLSFPIVVSTFMNTSWTPGSRELNFTGMTL